MSYSSHHRLVSGRLGKGLPHSAFFSQLVSPWDRESFSFLWDQGTSCPEPKFAVTALVMVGFLLGGLGHVLRLVTCGRAVYGERKGRSPFWVLTYRIIYYRT